MVQPGSSALHSVGTGEGNVFSFVCPEDLVALFLHEGDETLTASTLLHGFSDMVHQTELPALALLCCPVLSGRKVLSTALVGFQHSQSMSSADLITELAKLFQCAGVLSQLLSVFQADGVDHEVGMNMGSIAVSGHQHLMSRPCLFCKLLGNLVSLCRRDGFSG